MAQPKYKQGRLTNTMVFTVLCDLIGDTMKSNKKENYDVPGLLKLSKQSSMTLDKVREIKIKLLQNHLLLENSSIDNIFSVLNSVDENMLKNSTTVSVIIDLIGKEIMLSINKKFSGIDKLDELFDQFVNKKNSKSHELFKTAVRQRYQLREIVVYYLFPMIYTSFTKNEKIDKKQLDRLYSIASTQGFNRDNLEKVKNQLTEKTGYGNRYKTLSEKIQDRDILYKIGADIEIVGTGPIPVNNIGALKNTFVNKIKNGSSNLKKNAEGFLDNITTQISDSINTMKAENSTTADLQNLFTVLQQNTDIVIILELLDILRINLANQ